MNKPIVIVIRNFTKNISYIELFGLVFVFANEKQL